MNKTLNLGQIFYERREENKKEHDSMKIIQMETHEKFRVDTNISKNNDEYPKENFTMFRRTKTGIMDKNSESNKIEDIPEENPDEIFESHEATYRNKIEKYPRKLKRER